MGRRDVFFLGAGISMVGAAPTLVPTLQYYLFKLQILYKMSLFMINGASNIRWVFQKTRMTATNKIQFIQDDSHIHQCHIGVLDNIAWSYDILGQKTMLNSYIIAHNMQKKVSVLRSLGNDEHVSCIGQVVSYCSVVDEGLLKLAT